MCGARGGGNRRRRDHLPWLRLDQRKPV